MAKFSDKVMAVAAVYAEALLSLADRRGEADGLRDELDELARLADRNRDFAAFLASPLVDAGDRSKSLETMFRGNASDLLVDALQVIAKKGRIALVPAIAEAYRAAHDKRRGRVEVQVTSAVALDDGQRSRIRSAVAAKLGQEARLQETVDPALLGGLVVQIGDRKADSSIATRLEGLSRALIARGTREILSGSHFDADYPSADQRSDPDS